MDKKPIIICATGGSGTRLIAELLQHAGVCIGANLNHALDNFDTGAVLETYIPQVLEVTRSADYEMSALPKTLGEEMTREFSEAMTKIYQQRAHADQSWGWKNPRSIYMLPVIQALCPEVRVIHIIRDGRDMAYSENQRQTLKHFTSLFQKPLDEQKLPEAAIQLWDKVNREAADYGARALKSRFYTVRYEALCNNPEAEIAALFRWLKLPADIQKMSALVRPLPEIPRYQQQPAAEIAALQCFAGEGLQRFGYL